MNNNKRYWLSVEKYENWKIDKENQFTFLGVGSNKRKLAQKMRRGDFIITYVSSGHSSIADVREITSDGPKESRPGFVYSERYEYEVTTTPKIILSENKWISIHEFIGKLSFLKPGNDWRQALRQSLREIPESDAKAILSKVS